MTALPAKSSRRSTTRARWGRHWCLNDYGLRRHSRTQRRPLEHFQAEEQARPAAGADHAVRHPAVERAESRRAISSPSSTRRSTRFRIRTSASGVTARADAQIVRFYARGLLIKTHPRQAAGRPVDRCRATIPSSAASTRCAMSTRCGARPTPPARSSAATPPRCSTARLPWTRMRRVYALLGLVRRYGAARVTEVCTVALAADMLDVHRLQRMLEQGVAAATAAPPARVIPARALSPPGHAIRTAAPPPRPLKERSPNDDHRCASVPI